VWTPRVGSNARVRFARPDQSPTPRAGVDAQGRLERPVRFDCPEQARFDRPDQVQVLNSSLGLWSSSRQLQPGPRFRQLATCFATAGPTRVHGARLCCLHSNPEGTYIAEQIEAKYHQEGNSSVSQRWEFFEHPTNLVH
jgi:hypothetical protein